MPWILRTGGGDAIALEGEVTIGRSPQCTVRVSSPAISRVHCRLRATESHVVVMAEGKNGTFINGMRIGNIAHVGVGDVIEIDSERWQVQKADAAPPARAYAPPPAAVIVTPTSPFAFHPLPGVMNPTVPPPPA